MNSKVIDKLAWIYIVEKKVLCAKSKGKELFYIPGGKREPGESDQAALIREILEELSVNIQPDTIKYLGEFEAQADAKPEGTLVHMSCFTADYVGVLQSASEIAEAAWLGYSDRDKCSLVVQIIFDWLLEKELIE
jgi:8-oxo-dGTP pyrophosphatase MutT (NUDIX family)